MTLRPFWIANVMLAAFCLSNAAVGDVIAFGSGADSFSIDFVTIGSLGNAPDTAANPVGPAGAVSYTYDIGTYEVSADMISKYNSAFGTANSLEITQDDRDANKPATDVSWNEAARFVNWLNTSTGGHAAYKFESGGVNDDVLLWNAADSLDFDASNPTRSLRAT